MARAKKPKYEYIESQHRYRKRIKGPDGKYVAVYGATEKELTAKLAAVQQQITDDTFRRENPTVKEYSEKWLTIRGASVSGPTIRNYQNTVKRYILPVIGDKYMADITADDVNLIMVDVSHYSQSVYRNVHMLLKSIFKAARKSHIIDEDPTEDLNPNGGKKPDEKEALTDTQVTTLLDAAKGLPPYPFVMLCLYAGLRREEALALKWECVHLTGEAPYLEVKRVWTIVNNRPVIEERTKSAAGQRNIPIPDVLRACLEDLRTANKSDWVIANSDGQPLSGTQWQRLWKYIQTRTVEERTYYRWKNGVKTTHTITPKLGEKAAHNGNVVYSIDFHCTPHQLRHTYITNLIRAGVDPKTVQYLAGHDNIKVTMDIYAHLNYNRPEDLWQKVQNAIDAD